VNKPLHQSRPWDQNVIILAIRRGGQILPGIPGRNQVLQAGDLVTAYGEEQSVLSLLQPHADDI
jgi:Trk K+ transport system NAD-binding subunit